MFCVFYDNKNKGIPEEMECHNPCRNHFFFCGNFLYVRPLNQGCSLNYHHWMENYAKRRKNQKCYIYKRKKI